MSPRSVAPPDDAEAIRHASWRAVAPEFIDEWEQGQHLVLLGKTGQGKTTLAFDVLERRHEQREASVCVFVTKKRDETMAREGWPVIKAWPPPYSVRKKRRVVLWPTYSKASSYPRDVRPVFLNAIDEIMDEGNWTIYMDEASYLVQSIGLRTSMDELFTQSRSNGITLVAGSQRPVWVSRAQVSQPTWVAAFRIGDLDDAKRAGEVIGNRALAPTIMGLGVHHFLLANTVTDMAVVSKVGT